VIGQCQSPKQPLVLFAYVSGCQYEQDENFQYAQAFGKQDDGERKPNKSHFPALAERIKYYADQ
jgi:hypothetical protein